MRYLFGRSRCRGLIEILATTEVGFTGTIWPKAATRSVIHSVAGIDPKQTPKFELGITE